MRPYKYRNHRKTLLKWCPEFCFYLEVLLPFADHLINAEPGASLDAFLKDR